MWLLILAVIALAAYAGFRFARRTPPKEYFNYSDAAHAPVPPPDTFRSNLKVAVALIVVVAVFVGILALAQQQILNREERRHGIERME